MVGDRRKTPIYQFRWGLKEIAGIRSHAMLGKTRIEGRSDAESVEREKWERHQADLEAHRPFQNFEYQNKYGHETSWVSVSGKPFFNREGKFLGYRGMAWEITSRKQLEEELELSRERYQLALKSNLAGVWDWDIPSGAVVFDERWAEMLGYTLNEVELNVQF